MNKIFTLFLLFSFQIIFAQTTIRGKIIDNNTKETLIGANVIIKGTSIGTATNLDGFFKITTASGFPIVLTVSYLGYANKEVVVKGNKKDRIHSTRTSNNCQNTWSTKGIRIPTGRSNRKKGKKYGT